MMLQEEIRTITEGAIPMHMPGHKRNLMPVNGLPYEIDITEIDGADDLHDADGILAEAMRSTSQLCGSRRTWYLVGGSTCGILAGIRAAIPWGSEIIAARNCHRSVYHAVELGGYRVHWVYPHRDDAFDICLGIDAGEIERLLARCPDTAGVVITSPTYEGVLSDVRAIAQACHRRGIPLIVDEAHGAHLGLFEEGGFARGAISQHADLVVQSAHKTLPALTQTGFLHIGGDLIDETEVERQLAVFETSSPSYPLMASLDGCTQLLLSRGPELFAAWGRRLESFYQKTKDLQVIRIFDGDRDKSKILMSFREAGLSGAEAAAILRDRYGIEPEMSSGYNVLAMTGLGDSDENLEALAAALCDMDEMLMKEQNGESRSQICADVPRARAACTIFEAAAKASEEVPLHLCEGRISAEYLFIYPPGIPFLAPGEYIGGEHLSYIRERQALGERIRRSRGRQKECITCLWE